MIRSMRKTVLTGMVVIAITSIIYYIFFMDKYLNINITNNTGSTLNSLRITSNLLKKDISVPDIEAGKEQKVKINSSKEFMKGEGYLSLKCKMKDGKDEEFGLIGYMEGGTTGNIKVSIEEDENGKIYTSAIEKNGIHNILNY